MPRFFFNCSDGRVEVDDEGVELADLRTARVEAVAFIGASLKDDPERVAAGEDFRIDVTNERGVLLFSVIASAIDAP